MAVGGSISLKVAASKSGSPSVGSALWSGGLDHALSFGNGTTANNIDLVYVSERTVASNTTDNVDVAGVLTDGLGATITAAEIVAIVVMNKRASGVANTTNLTIGSAAASNELPGFDVACGVVKPNGMFLLVNPDATGIATVTAGTADILPIVNSTGASNTYQLAIFARSA